MKVKDLYTSQAIACRPHTTILQAARLMERFGVGALPITDSSSRLVGTLTDRDIALKLASRNLPASSLRVEDVMTRPAASVLSEDDALFALELMADLGVHRLPVADQKGHLDGMLSLDDFIRRAAAEDGTGDITYEAIIRALAEVTRTYRAEGGRLQVRSQATSRRRSLRPGRGSRRSAGEPSGRERIVREGTSEGRGERLGEGRLR